MSHPVADIGTLGEAFGINQIQLSGNHASVSDTRPTSLVRSVSLLALVYEDLVKDSRRIGAGVAQACGLPWVDSALDFHTNSAASLTTSASQVRRPIDGSSSGRWRHYGKNLLPLIEALRRSGISLPLYVKVG